MSALVIRLEPAGADDRCLTWAERDECERLGAPELRRAARVAAKRAAASLLEPRVPYDDLTDQLVVQRGGTGAPRLSARHDLAQPLPAISMSHAAGWGAALAWLP